MDDYEMDEAESSGLDSLYAAEEEGEETANITSAASRGALMFGAPEIFSKYNEATKEYETSTQEVLRQMQAARDKLLNQPTEQSRGEQLRGIAMALAAPRERDDPRFYERRSLYTFLRDIGEYGAEQKAAQKKAEEEKQKQISLADFQIAEEKAKIADAKRRELARLVEKYVTSVPKGKGQTARTQSLVEEAALRGITVQDLLRLKDEQRKKQDADDKGLSPADVRSIRLEVASTLSGPKDRLTTINEGLSNLGLAIQGNPQAEAQLNRSLATISGDKQLSMAEVESVVGAGSFAQRVTNAISKFFTGGAGDLTNEQKKELLETYEAYYANQYNNSRNRLKKIYEGAGLVGLPEDMFDSPYISVRERRRRKLEEDAKAEKAKLNSNSISLTSGKLVRPAGQ